MAKSLLVSASSAIVVLLVIMIAIFTGVFISGNIEDTNEADVREISATVNGARVYFDDVEKEYDSLSPEQKITITKADALSFVIERRILYQEAVKNGLKATESEVDDWYIYYLEINNLTEEELKQQFEGQSSTVEDFKVILRKQVLINKLFDEKIRGKFLVKFEEVEAFYNQSSYPARNISFEEAEADIVNYLTFEQEKELIISYIEHLKEQAEVLIVAIPS